MIRIGALATAILLLTAPGASSAPRVTRVDEGIRVWYADEAARESAPVSLALTPAMRRDIAQLPARTPSAGLLTPQFRTVHGRPAVYVPISDGTSLYGTGEAAGPLLRNGRRHVAWNYDAYGWHARSEMLYKSHPWVLAVRADGSSFGVLADTPQRAVIDLKDGILITAEGPRFPVYLLGADSPAEVVRQLARLTGTIPLPPLWALGYHQCRYSYTPQERVLEVATEFRERRIPADVIWLDIDYMDRRRSFTWHPEDFDDPAGLMRQLRAIDFRSIAILDPAIPVDPRDRIYASGQVLDAWVERADGSTYTGEVWPGACVFPDFTRSDVRRWWGEHVGEFVRVGIDGVWNDMNEPAVFNVESKTMPPSNVHRADPEFGGTDTHARYHNVYGRLMSRATYEGLQRTRPERRPFVLTRASHVGGQRWAATWSGDNSANWSHLDMSIPVVLNMGLSAWPLSGPDIGGFKGSGSGQLFARWMGIGALLPFARGHTEKGSAQQEPWSYDEATEATCRRALERRYRLLPYLYTMTELASREGTPLCRPVFFEDPADLALRDIDDSFLLGSDLLVVCRTTPGARLRVPAPFEGWPVVDLGVGGASDPELPQLRLRPGALIPLAPVAQHTTDAEWEELELLVAFEDESATALLYEDEGEGFGHERDDYRRWRITVTDQGDQPLVRWQHEGGNAALFDRRVRIRVAGG